MGVALELLDRVGLPDLTMRRLAAELDVQPSALYWHFESKQVLLGAVAERILAPLDATAPDCAEDVAHRTRDALLSCRDGAEVVLSSYALGFGAGRAQERLEQALRADRSPTPDATAEALLQFILGNVFLAQQRMHAESHGAAAADVPALDSGAEVFAHGVAALLGVRTG